MFLTLGLIAVIAWISLVVVAVALSAAAAHADAAHDLARRTAKPLYD
jgi:hypothetical protein